MRASAGIKTDLALISLFLLGKNVRKFHEIYSYHGFCTSLANAVSVVLC